MAINVPLIAKVIPSAISNLYLLPVNKVAQETVVPFTPQFTIHLLSDSSSGPDAAPGRRLWLFNKSDRSRRLAALAGLGRLEEFGPSPASQLQRLLRCGALSPLEMPTISS
jgi:hypothetical protein